MIPKTKKAKKRDSRQTIFFSTLIGFLVLGVIGFLVFSNLRISQKRAELTTKIESLKREIQILETKKAELQAGILQTGSESYWEEKIREQGYKKSGEEAVVVLPSEEKEGEKVEEEKSFWQSIFKKLGF